MSLPGFLPWLFTMSATNRRNPIVAKDDDEELDNDFEDDDEDWEDDYDWDDEDEDEDEELDDDD